MKGLIQKDFYLMFRYCKIIMVISLIFTCVPVFAGQDSAFFMFYPFVIATMLPVSIISYDERDKWNVYCGTLPVTRADYVSAKYICGIVIMLVLLCVSAASQYLAAARAGCFSASNYVSILATLTLIGCAAPGFALPFVLKLGVEKGRIAYYIIIGIFCALGVWLPENADFAQGGIDGISPVVILCAAVVIYGVSWLMSIRFYEKREL